MKQGADYIECDVQVTKDLHLFCNHSPWLSKITEDLCSNTKFSKRKRKETVLYEDPYHDGKYAEWNVTDWFMYDFTADELHSLKRIQPVKHRDQNYNFKEYFCSFQEYIDLAKELNVGIYPEIKYPYFINSILNSRGQNITVEELMVNVLNENGFNDSKSHCFIQSFEKKSLKNVKAITNLKRIYLLWEDEQHLRDLDSGGRLLKNQEMWRVALDWGINENIDGFGLDKNFILSTNESNYISNSYSYMVDDAKEHGMLVHVYTFAHDKEDSLPWNFGKDPYLEYTYYLKVGIDGFFTDFPAIANRFLGENDVCDLNIGKRLCRSEPLLIVLLVLVALIYVEHTYQY